MLDVPLNGENPDGVVTDRTSSNWLIGVVTLGEKRIGASPEAEPDDDPLEVEAEEAEPDPPDEDDASCAKAPAADPIRPSASHATVGESPK